MQFGISYPTYVRAWHDVVMAEEYGFSHAWFDDSHMCYSDIFATMALAAEHSRTSVVGSFVLSARNVMGMPATPLKALADEVKVLRELLAGKEALYREDDRERAVRLLHPGMGFINVRDPIPIYVGANL